MQNGGCSLDSKVCTPCKGGVPPLAPEQIIPLKQQLPDGWQIIEDKKLEKSFKFKNFREALVFVNKVGDLAENQGHHPDIFLAWGLVRLTIWTHKIGGLHENDFIFAAKADKLYV